MVWPIIAGTQLSWLKNMSFHSIYYKYTDDSERLFKLSDIGMKRFERQNSLDDASEFLNFSTVTFRYNKIFQFPIVYQRGFLCTTQAVYNDDDFGRVLRCVNRKLFERHT